MDTGESLKPPKTSAPTRAHVRKLTIRQRRFIDGKLKGQSSAEAAREAGYSESVARNADRIISEGPNVRAAIDEILLACEISDQLLALLELICRLKGYLMKEHIVGVHEKTLEEILEASYG